MCKMNGNSLLLSSYLESSVNKHIAVSSQTKYSLSFMNEGTACASLLNPQKSSE